MPAPDPAAGIVTVGCDPYGNWTGFVIDELLVSGSEKRPEAIRDSFMRKKPFAD
jgi:hypothetical protein